MRTMDTAEVGDKLPRLRSGQSSASYPVASSLAASRAMRGNTKTGTRPEVLLRSLLHARGWRFFKNRAVDVFGTTLRPDIVFPGKRVAVFVDGCFWHLCPDHARLPRGANSEYWHSKLEGNSRRDRTDQQLLEMSGWRVVRVWEHDIPGAAIEEVEAALAEIIPG